MCAYSPTHAHTKIILHISTNKKLKTDMQLKWEQYSMTRVAPDWLLY
jgi:hypothetical protein